MSGAMDSPETLCRQAERKMKGGFLSFFSGGPNYEDACDLYVNAANKYKLTRNWEKASQCFLQASYVQERLGDTTRQASLVVEAGNALKKVSSQEAARCFEKAAELFNNSGRFGQSAKMMKSIAEVFETEGNVSESMKYYKRAADFFDMDEYGKSQYTSCIIKYAEFASKQDKYIPEAIKIFETEGFKALKNSLIQYGAKEHFLKAGILHLCKGDPLDARIAADRYRDADHRFATSREGHLLFDMITAYEEQDHDKLTAAIQEYDRISPIDPWKVHFLTRIAGALEDAAPVSSGNARDINQLATDKSYDDGDVPDLS